MMDFKEFADLIKILNDKHCNRSDLKVLITRSRGNDIFCLMDDDSNVIEHFRMI